MGVPTVAWVSPHWHFPPAPMSPCTFADLRCSWFVMVKIRIVEQLERAVLVSVYEETVLWPLLRYYIFSTTM